MQMQRLILSRLSAYTSALRGGDRRGYTDFVQLPPSPWQYQTEIIQAFEPLLRQYEKDTNLAISEAKEELGTKVGENFMSVVLRTTIKGWRGDGTPYVKSFMRKKRLEKTHIANIARNDALFRNEAYFYKTLLPRLGRFGPACIQAQPYEIILEDLSERNFTICKRQNFLDLDHASAVVETLASMHGASLSLKFTSPEYFQKIVTPLRENILPVGGKESLGSYLKRGVDYAIRSLQSIENTPKVRRVLTFLESFSDNVEGVMGTMLVPKEGFDDRYWVISHGDTWNNNLMFRYNPEGKPVDVKLVDFAAARHSSPALDFTYFLYTSVKPEVIENHTDELISTYERFLLHDLRRLEVPEHELDVLSQNKWFVEEIKRYGLFGLCHALLALHAVLLDEERALQYEIERLRDPEHKMPSFYDAPIEPEKTKRILFVVDHFIQNFTNNS